MSRMCHVTSWISSASTFSPDPQKHSHTIVFKTQVADHLSIRPDIRRERGVLERAIALSKFDRAPAHDCQCTTTWRAVQNYDAHLTRSIVRREDRSLQLENEKPCPSSCMESWTYNQQHLEEDDVLSVQVKIGRFWRVCEHQKLYLSTVFQTNHKLPNSKKRCARDLLGLIRAIQCYSKRRS